MCPVDSRAMTPDDLIAAAVARASLADQRSLLRAALHERGLPPDLVDAVLAHTSDGIVLRAAGAQEPGGRIGGPGVLPNGENWPRLPDGRPLTFLGHFDLSRLPQMAPLPVAGNLLIYWDFEAFDNWWTAGRVFWAPDGAELITGDQPDGGYPQLAPFLVSGYAQPIVGAVHLFIWSLIDDQSTARMALRAINELTADLCMNQLLGAVRECEHPIPDEIGRWFAKTTEQTPPGLTEAQRAGSGWTLLAQFQGDPAADHNFGFADSGCLYLLVSASDLANLRFDRVIGIVDSA